MSTATKHDDWTDILDAAIEERFGIEAETKWSIFSDSHVTGFETGDEELSARINAFIAGFMTCYEKNI